MSKELISIAFFRFSEEGRSVSLISLPLFLLFLYRHFSPPLSLFLSLVLFLLSSSTRCGDEMENANKA